jgi:MFS family permease
VLRRRRSAATEARPPGAPGKPSLWRNQDFRRLWIGQTVSQVGSQVSLVAVPFTAVVVLGVSPFQAGLLGMFEFLPFLLVGLPAGAIVDRLPHRAVLIVSDIGRTLVMGSIPVAAVLGDLTLVQLYIAAFISGVLTVFFDVAYQSYLPALVEPSELVDGNGKLELSRSAATLSGPSLGGALASLIGAPKAIAVDAASYVWSVVFLLRIRRRDVVEKAILAPGEDKASMRSQIGEGLRYVVTHRLLRPIACCTATWNLFGNMTMAIYVLFAVRELGMSATTIGVVLSVGALGNLAGAAVVSRLTQRIGVGKLIVAGVLVSPIAFLVPFATSATAIPFLIAAGVVESFGGVIYNVGQVSLRQGITPSRLLGRLNASMRFIVWGTIPIGSFLGGVLGGTIGLRPTLVVGAMGTTLSAGWVLFSPVPAVQRIEDELHPERRRELESAFAGDTLDGGVAVTPLGAAEEMTLPT